jgi:hypothetical protein
MLYQYENTETEFAQYLLEVEKTLFPNLLCGNVRLTDL